MAPLQPNLLPSMKPCLRRICFDSTDWEQLPATPILSILQLKFISEVNLEDTSQPVSALWRNSVEFVSTLPGFQGLYWAPVDPSAVIILIQWDSGTAWSRFQCSLGFSMLLGYLENVTNRCVQLALPAHLSNACFRLDLVSYDFPAPSDTSQIAPEERQSNFKERWISLLQPGVINDMVYACGDWIEDDYLMKKHFFGFGHSRGLIEEDFKVANHYFAGLVFWKTDIHSDVLSNMADQFAILAQEANTVVTCLTEQMRYEGLNASASQKSASGPLSSQSNYNYQLLNIPVIRRCDLDDSSRLEREDRVHLAAAEASFSNGDNRIVPSPAGTWSSMGSINQYEMPKEPHRWTSNMLEMVSFRLLHITSHFKNAFGDLRDAIWKLSGRGYVRQAVAHKDPTRKFLLAGVGNIKSKPVQVQQHFHQIIRDFETACTGTIEDFSYSQIPGPEPPNLQVHNLEITNFYISGRESDSRSFEYAFDNLLKYGYLSLPFSVNIFTDNDPVNQNYTSPEKYGPPIHNSRTDAVFFHGMGYELEQRTSDGDLQTTKFTSTWHWKSKSPGQETWHAEFAERAQNEYENLGHIIDWLRTLCKSSDNVFLVFESVDKEIGPLEMADLASKQLPRPGRLFGGPD